MLNKRLDCLIYYGRHSETCPTRFDSMYKPKPVCNCGFDEAIEAAKTEQPVGKPRLVSPPFAAMESGDYRWNDETGELCFLGTPKRESGWLSPATKPKTVGLGEEKSVSMPLLFKTVIPDVGTHIRLGYYDAKREAFIESGIPDQTYKERVTCWYQFEMPPTTDIEDQPA